MSTPSSRPHARLGESSSPCPKRSPPSECAIGRTSVRFEGRWYYRLSPDELTEEQSPQKGSPRLARRPNALRIKTKRDLARPKSELALRGDPSRSCRRYSWLMGAGASVTSRRYPPRPSNVPASPIAISTVANPGPITSTPAHRGGTMRSFAVHEHRHYRRSAAGSLAPSPLGHGPCRLRALAGRLSEPRQRCRTWRL